MERLPGSAFDRVFKNGNRIPHRTMVLIALIRPAPSVRLGVVIGRNILKSAVARNRLRRILRESFRQEAGQLPAPAMDCILLVRASARSFQRRKDADEVIQKMLRKL